jgi:hypothetical protein
MTIVVLACVCVDSHIGARIESENGAAATTVLFEESGKKELRLASGVYSLAYRAEGAPGTPFSLRATQGATMTPVDRKLPPDGAAAGVRTLIVRSVWLALAAALVPAHAHAQQPASAVTPRAAAERALSTLPNVSDLVAPGYYLSLEASADSKTGTATAAVDTPSGAFSAALSLQAPLTDAAHEARPLSLNGLSNSAAASLAVHWFRWPGSPDTARMRALCQRALQTNECDDTQLTRAADRREFLRLSHAGDTPIILTARATLGRRTFHYAERATLETASETHDDVAAAAGAGRYDPRLGYVGVEYQFLREFDAGDSEQLCVLRDADRTLECRSAVLGAPSRLTRQGAAIEWRRFLPGGRVAVNPTIARDFRNGVTAVDVPIYFLRLDGGALAGGVRAAWRSDTNVTTVSVFVGAALRLTQ